MPVVHRLAAAALLAALSQAHAAERPPSNLQARTWAATCASCHHADIAPRAPGARLAAQTLPSLAGRSQAELIDALQAFRNGTRPATVMGQIARGYDDAQIAAIAGWLSRQPQEAP